MKNQFLVDVQYILKYEVLSHEHQFFFKSSFDNHDLSHILVLIHVFTGLQFNL